MMPNLGLTDFCESLKGKKLLLDTKHNNEFADRVCAKEDRRNFRWQTSHRHLHSLERQPEGVQVVEWIDLIV